MNPLQFTQANSTQPNFLGTQNLTQSSTAMYPGQPTGAVNAPLSFSQELLPQLMNRQPSLSPASNTMPLTLNKTGGVSFPAPATKTAPAPAPQPLAASMVNPNANMFGQMNQAPSQTITAANAGQSNFSIPTEGAVPSTALSSTLNANDLTNKRNQYQQYLEGLYNATVPTPEYLDALKQAQDAKQMGMQIQADFLTNPAYPGDTYGFAQGVEGRQLALNSLQQNAAANSLNVQQAIRSGNIDAYKALVQGAQPQPLGYGQMLQSPLGGAPVAVGQNQPSFSATASPFGGYLVFNQRTGQYEQINPTGMGGAGAQGQLPTFLQPALGQTFTGQHYLDMSLISPQQLPYAQSVSASMGIPLLSKEDVNKIQDAQATYNSGVGLIDNVSSLANGLIWAQSSGQAIAQAAQLNLQSNIPGSQAKLYSDARNGFLSLITRAAGEKGTLAEGDVLRIQAALPSFSDTQATAAKKLQTLQNIFGSAVQGNIAAYLGSKVNTSTGAPSATSGGIDISQYAF